MRRGRKAWTRLVPRALLSEIRSAAGSRQEAARAVFERFGLARYTRLSTFQHYCAVMRRDRVEREGPKSTDRGVIPAGRDEALDTEQVQAEFEELDAQRSRTTWGKGGLRRLRRSGLAALDGRALCQVGFALLLDHAERLRSEANALVDLAHTLVGYRAKRRPVDHPGDAGGSE